MYVCVYTHICNLCMCVCVRVCMRVCACVCVCLPSLHTEREEGGRLAVHVSATQVASVPFSGHVQGPAGLVYPPHSAGILVPSSVRLCEEQLHLEICHHLQVSGGARSDVVCVWSRYCVHLPVGMLPLQELDLQRTGFLWEFLVHE